MLETIHQNGYPVSKVSFQKGLQAAKEYYQEHRWDHRTKDALKNFWADYYRVLLESLEDRIYNEALVSEIQNRVQSELRYHLYQETLQVLTDLKHRDYNLAIVSNWNSSLPAICESLGLSPYFEILVVSDIVGWRKPQPQIFELALDELNIPAEAALHVGDDYNADVIGALGAGIAPIHLDRKPGSCKRNCIHIHSLEELLQALDLVC